MKRIQKFLLCDEINTSVIDHNNQDLKTDGVDMLIDNCNFTWGGKKDEKIKENKENKEENEEENSKKEEKKGKKFDNQYF